MLSSVAFRRCLINANTKAPAQVRLLSTSSGRKFHSTPKKEQSDGTVETSPTAAPVVEEKGMGHRFQIMAEVTISKIFPAGFGWQSFSVIADDNGFSPDSLNFALTTGVGDGIGVLTGHMLFYSAKKAIADSSINLTQELHTAILLGSAAFCSGTAWQPIVNVLQGANLPFNGVFAGTWLGCGLAFYGGLRAGRTILSGPLQYIEEPTYENGKNDISLSTAIGGATAFFVGTDAAYLPSQNFLIDIVGIQDGTPDLTGCAIAGSSTALGFMSAQTGMNFIYPKGKCWLD